MSYMKSVDMVLDFLGFKYWEMNYVLLGRVMNANIGKNKCVERKQKKIIFDHLLLTLRPRRRKYEINLSMGLLRRSKVGVGGGGRD